MFTLENLSVKCTKTVYNYGPLNKPGFCTCLSTAVMT